MTEAPAPATPRPSATILLLRDDPLRVLMIQRHHEQMFASALVFPGGKVDPGDGSDEWLDLLTGVENHSSEERGYRVAAFRETYEEAGVLLARDASGAHVGTVAPGQADFLEVVRASGGRLCLDDLVLFGHWITPALAPKRFDTRFYLAAMPMAQEAETDGNEAVAHEWVEPGELIMRAGLEFRDLVLPTRMNLLLLSKSGNLAEAMADARARPVFPVVPVPTKGEDGTLVLHIPAEAGYGVTEHRTGMAVRF
jgi:8-oxo-dGTP pyrophosphatase MutT (NUDIX family)